MAEKCNLQELEQEIDYSFRDKVLLEHALCHSSYANEHHLTSNERLEFLGDSVLSIIVAEFLFKNYKHLPEGELTKIRASLVCEKSLFDFAGEISLGSYLMLGRGEELSGGRTRASLVSDAFEALLAAIYLDAGMDEAKRFVLRFVTENITTNHTAFIDYKTNLQEIIQQNKEEKVEYVVVGEQGPDHDKYFFVEVHLNSNVLAKGKGKSKKEAEQDAARQVLQLMGRF